MSYLAGLVATELVGDPDRPISGSRPHAPGLLAVEVLFRILYQGLESEAVGRTSRSSLPAAGPSSVSGPPPMMMPGTSCRTWPSRSSARLNTAWKTSWGKVREYFQAGVRLVLIVYPVHARIHVYEAWEPHSGRDRDGRSSTAERSCPAFAGAP